MSDRDSLFGSPPPSPPARGRSPSLALPESSGWRLEDAQTSSQNVGTIALPGSQSHSSELPVFPKPALPSKNYVLQLRPPAQRKKAPLRRQSTSRTSSPIPSPTPHNARTDRTLRDLVGLISHFAPAASATSFRPPPISVHSPRASQAPRFYPPGSAQNPIEIDDAPGPADAVNSALIALAGTVATALKLPTAPQDAPLSKPIVNNVLHYIKHDPKLIPALQATYEYLGSIPHNSQPSPHSFSHSTTNQFDPSSSESKKRKRKYPGPQVPAGAGHWDVPFPFAPGEEPSAYPSQWHLERGRHVLGELLGLFERGFAKVRGGRTASPAKVSSQRSPRKQYVGRGAESVPGCDREQSSAGVTDRGSIAVVAAEDPGLDYQRMTEWLSSVPPLSSSSIVDSTNLTDMPSPSTSDAAPLSSNSLLDFMATLGPDFSENLNTGAYDKDHDFDYQGAFDDLDVGMGGDDMTWQAILGSGSTLQSINDITAFSIPDLESPAIPTEIHEFALDPALAPSQQQETQASQAVAESLRAVPAPSTLPMDPHDPIFQAASSDALPSLMESGAGSSHQRLSDQCVTTGVGTDVDLGDAQSVDAQSLLTVPTASGSSSQRGSTPTVYAQGSMSPALSAIAGSSAPGQTKVERKTAVLTKAREYREQLIKELQRVQVQRWELLIEGGVLRNLEKAEA